MHKGILRKVGGSVVVSLPPALLDQLQIGAKSIVGIAVQGDRIIIQPQKRPRYSLAELLAASDIRAPEVADDDWASGGPVGRELL